MLRSASKDSRMHVLFDVPVVGGNVSLYNEHNLRRLIQPRGFDGRINYGEQVTRAK